MSYIWSLSITIQRKYIGKEAKLSLILARTASACLHHLKRIICVNCTSSCGYIWLQLICKLLLVAKETNQLVSVTLAKDMINQHWKYSLAWPSQAIDCTCTSKNDRLQMTAGYHVKHWLSSPCQARYHFNWLSAIILTAPWSNHHALGTLLTSMSCRFVHLPLLLQVILDQWLEMSHEMPM